MRISIPFPELRSYSKSMNAIDSCSLRYSSVILYDLLTNKNN
nr:MAG TPA: hypothetical protein [Caudoviricetes sp.]